jgi:hypothetical protein
LLYRMLRPSHEFHILLEAPPESRDKRTRSRNSGHEVI